ncbi:MAG: hypothetical protein ACI8WT_004939 [Clostridium sp.]|jgi:hypothetical protein
MNIKTNKYDLYKSSAIEIYKMVLRGDLKKFPAYFWQRPDADKNAMEITKYLLEEILKWSSNDIKKKLSQSIFVEHKLNGMLQQVYNQSPFEAFNAAYPNRFKSWELGCVPKNYWELDVGIEATKWLIEEKLKYLENDIKKIFLLKYFMKMVLMVCYICYLTPLLTRQLMLHTLINLKIGNLLNVLVTIGL